MPGISAVKIGMPFSKKGMNWSSYWSTRTPTLLNVTSQADTTTNFSWTAGADEPEGYKLKISSDGVTYTDKATVAGNVTSVQATGLTAGVLYYFKVVAYSGTNESDPTNIYDTRFKITIDTTKAGSANDTFVLPCGTGGSFNAYVDWGDGSAEQNITGTPGNVTHDYNQTGTFQIKIRGAFQRISFAGVGDKLKLMSIDNWGNINWSQDGLDFYGCENMEANYIDQPNTVGITVFDNFFMTCRKFNGSVSGFDTSAATRMSNFFRNCDIFNQPVNHFDVSNCEYIQAMFMDAWAFNQPVTSWRMTAAVDMHKMFAECKVFNQPVSQLDPHISGYTNDMQGVFMGCLVFNQEVNWPNATPQALDSFVDRCAYFNSAITLGTTVACIDFQYMFSGCTRYNQPVTFIDDTSAGIEFNHMFNKCTAFNQSVAHFDTSAATKMNAMFSECPVFNQSLANFDTSLVTTMQQMFWYDFAFKQSLATFNMEALAATQSIFAQGCNINTTGSTANYDATLIAWAAQTLPTGIVINMGTSKYSAGAAATARAVLTNAPNSWTITDGGQA